MTYLVKIAVDAMGGEGSPKKTMDGLVHNHLSKKNNYYKIFGDKAKILIALNNRIDPKITNRIWKNMIWSYIDFERRNFKKK